MDYAIKTWDWVNRKEENFFYLISHHHHPGCGPDDERNPHKIASISYDEMSLTTVLSRINASWDETLQELEFEFKTVKHPALLAKRQNVVGDTLAGFANGVSSAFCKAAGWFGMSIPGCDSAGMLELPHLLDSVSSAALTEVWENIPEFDSGEQSNEFNWGVDDPNHRVQLVGGKTDFPTEGIIDPPDKEVDIPGLPDDKIGKIDGNPKASTNTTVTCIGCYITGTVVYSACGKRNKDGQVDLTVDFRPNIRGRLEVEFQGKVEIEKEFNLLEMFVTAALKGYNIDKIITLEPSVLNGPGVELKAGVEGNFTTGFSMNTGPSSSLKMSATRDSGGVRVGGTGWEDFTADPIFRVNALKTRSEVTPYFRIGIGIGAQFFKDSVVSGRVGIWGGLVPNIATTLEQGYDQEGMCGDKPEIGAKLETKFKVDWGYKTVGELKSTSSIISFLASMIPRPQFLEDIEKGLNKNEMTSLVEKGFSLCKAFET
ncbi:hypothetical protein ABW20_dc0109173 [Dactylellina cionopaga]|nr:hypothetical protein ABW20_dc0109173 [Dactylellina cionopaga]